MVFSTHKMNLLRLIVLVLFDLSRVGARILQKHTGRVFVFEKRSNPVRVLLLETVGVFAGVDHVESRLPMELFLRFGYIREVLRHIPASPGVDDIRDFDSVGFLERMDELQNGGPFPRSKVINHQAGLILKPLQGSHMALS